MRPILMPLVAVSVATVALSGCATKKFVGREVGEINQKVDTLNGEVEKTQERVRLSETRIDDVDKQAQAVIRDPKEFARQARKRATGAQRPAGGELVHTMALSNDKAPFPGNRASLSTDARPL